MRDLATASIFLVVIRSRATANARLEVNENVRFAGEHMQRTTKESQTAALSGSCPSNTLNITTDDGAVTYQIVGGVLTRTLGAGAPESLTSSRVVVEIFNGQCVFTIVNGAFPARPTLLVKMKIRYNDGGKPELAFYDVISTTFSLR